MTPLGTNGSVSPLLRPPMMLCRGRPPPPRRDPRGPPAPPRPGPPQVPHQPPFPCIGASDIVLFGGHLGGGGWLGFGQDHHPSELIANGGPGPGMTSFRKVARLRLAKRWAPFFPAVLSFSQCFRFTVVGQLPKIEVPSQMNCERAQDSLFSPLVLEVAPY